MQNIAYTKPFILKLFHKWVALDFEIIKNTKKKKSLEDTVTTYVQKSACSALCPH